MGDAVSHHVQGMVRDYDVDGDGACLATALIAYAADCRRAAKDYQGLAADLLAEAERAEAAATAAANTHDSAPRHYPSGMGEESRRLHREYNRLVAAQAEGALNGADVVRLTDEAAAKGIILVPGGESL